MTHQELVDTFRNWAIQHKQIQHTVGGLDRFTVSRSEILLKGLTDKLALDDFCLVLYEDDIEGRISNNNAEQYRDDLTLGFEVIKVCPLEDEAVQTATQSQAKAICLSFWRRMLYHQRNREGFFANGRLRLGELTYAFVSGGPENTVGCFARFSLSEPAFGVDPTFTLATDWTI